MTLLGSEHSILIRSKFRSVLQLRLQQRRTREQLADTDIMPFNRGKFPKQEDSYAFEEDSSSESLSPELHSDESQGSACPSSEAVGSTPSSSSSPAVTSPQKAGATGDPPDQSQDESLCSTHKGQGTPHQVPAIVKSKASDKNRHKKPKDLTPKVKKLKYHQYIPPHQKAEKSPPPMDSAYAQLVQQQQLFLQLQILSQQKHAHTQQRSHTSPLQAQRQRQPAFSYQPHAPLHKALGDPCSSHGSSVPHNTANSNIASPVKNSYIQSNISHVKPTPLPANLDDLKVAELRQHLRIRGLPVSGTKTALIERLRPHLDHNTGSSPSGSSDITTVTFPVTPTGSLSSYQSPSSSSALSQGYYPYPSTSSTPPISPASSELSLSGSLPESFSDVPMSSPTQFVLQQSPAQLGMDGGGLTVGGPHRGECGEMDEQDAEKDKMLVEKQKVIEELTWKLHQEQRQVEELKMQLHNRKRSYGATEDTIIPPAQSHQPSMHHGPAMMDQHFYGVTVKKEPLPLSTTCPFSSPKQIKGSGNVGHCNNLLPDMGANGGSQSIDPTSSSESTTTMTSFLSPQCSPKQSSSPKSSSPNTPYLLPIGMGRDNRSHHHPSTNNSRGCGMQQIRSQQMDELLDVLIETGEMPANVREEKERSSGSRVEHPVSVFPGCACLPPPRFHRHYEELSPAQLPYDHSASHVAEGHLQTLSSSTTTRGEEMTLHKMSKDNRSPDDEANCDRYSGTYNNRHPHHSQQDKLLTNRDLTDTPLSPISNTSTGPELQGTVSMTLSEAPWENMEWPDLMPLSSAMTFSVAPPSVPGIFNPEFLDDKDINWNADLHLEHW
ncbi:myocardin isoform X2 [Synchiropus splendidus]|uniref:myocardin isoform X2 n=1 Tax=Synchiropus splendidus TaxID=270530 RepID=UPI00237DCA3B|nr:myocardin isoform X2 [Synchiropus splendidus]